MANERPHDTRLWNASLSTMWAVTRSEPFAAFFPAARRLGFARHELNHAVTGAMLVDVAPKTMIVSSVHEPCPTDVPKEERKAAGYVISSLDARARAVAVGFLRDAIDLAHRLGASAVVVHPGEVAVDRALEQRMRQLFEQGETGSAEYAELASKYAAERAAAAPAHLEEVRASLLSVADHAEACGVRLGLENRDHYYEIPLPDEMAELLALRPGTIEYWHDVGHAAKLDHLGFHDQVEWLERFATRVIGIHLHDIDGLTDHIAPGLGSVEWSGIADFIPRDAIRTFEVRGFTTPDQIRAAQELLHRAGCIEHADD